MSKSIKLTDNTYWDSQSIVHNKTKLSEILQPIILWKNESPGNAISSDKTIKLLNFNYEYLVLYYMHSTDTNFLYSTVITKGYGTRIGIETLDGICYRSLKYISDNEYLLSKIATTSPYTNTERLVISLYIVGYNQTKLINS